MMNSSKEVPLTPKKALIEAYRQIVTVLEDMCGTEAERANFVGTPARMAKSLLEMNWDADRIQEAVKNALSVRFPMSGTYPMSDSKPSVNSRGMIVQGPIRANSMCPHHLLPVMYEVWLSYIPLYKRQEVLGLSKLSRIVKALSHRTVLQEQLTQDIADALYQYRVNGKVFFASEGSIVCLNGLHTCMICRGVESNASTGSTEIRGAFWGDTLEQKFFQQVGLLKGKSLFKE